MEVIFHPLVRGDVLQILSYYESIAFRLASDFQKEVQATILKACANPGRFPETEGGFWRANLRRFPYHILFDVQEEFLRVLVVRHHRRHPQFGLRRHWP